MSTRTIIIGGGISGLTAAYALGRECILIEQRPELGGIMATREIEGCRIEAGPDSFLAAKPAAMKLITEIGMADQVIGSNDHQRATLIRRHGRMTPMPEGLTMMVPTKIMPIVRTPLFGWGTKMRMALDWFRRPPAEPTADRSVAQFVRDHYGDEAVDYLAEPLMAGVYGGAPSDLGVAATLPRFFAFEHKYGSLTRGVLAEPVRSEGGSLFRALKGGFGSLITGLRQAIGGRLRVVNARAEAIEAGYRVRAGGEWFEAEQVVVAMPACHAAPLLRSLDPQLSQLLGQIRYLGASTIGLVYDEKDLPPLSGFGFLVPACERDYLSACTFVHRKFDHRAQPGRALLRAFTADVESPEAEAIGRARADLERLLGIKAEPRATSMGRWPESMAQYGVGHAAHVAGIEDRLRRHTGLRVIGNAFHGVGIPDCIQLARDAAQSLPG